MLCSENFQVNHSNFTPYRLFFVFFFLAHNAFIKFALKNNRSWIGIKMFDIFHKMPHFMNFA